MTTAGPAPKNFGRTGLLAAAVLTLVVAGLYLWLLFHAGAFCGDEVNVINLADTHSLSLMTHDSFPVLLPALVCGWRPPAGERINLKFFNLSLCRSMG